MTTESTPSPAQAEALALLEEVANEGNVMGKGFGFWVRDKVESVMELIKEKIDTPASREEMNDE